MKNITDNFKPIASFWLIVAGGVLFGVTTVVGCVATDSAYWLFAMLAYIVFAAFSIAGQYIRKCGGAAIWQNSMQFLKAVAVCSMFLLPGAFGNIHSDATIGVLHSILLFVCVLFTAVDIFFEAVCISRSTAVSTALPKAASLTAAYFPFATAVTMTVTAVLYILSFGMIGPIWFLSIWAVYALCSSVAQSVYGKDTVGAVVTFAAAAAVKYATAGILFDYGLPLNIPGLDSRVFAGALTAFMYIDVAMFAISLAIDAAIIIFMSFALYKKTRNKQENAE